jgi:hypothetical protein
MEVVVPNRLLRESRMVNCVYASRLHRVNESNLSFEVSAVTLLLGPMLFSVYHVLVTWGPSTDAGLNFVMAVIGFGSCLVVALVSPFER